MSQTLLERAPNTGTGQRRIAVGMALVLVAQLMLVLDATVVNVALPHIAGDLGFGPASLSWVLNAYSLAFGGLLLLGGRLGDVFGRLRFFWTGLAVFTVFSFVGGIAVDPAMLVLARAFQGVGAAMAAPSVLALLTTNAPNDAARNRALAAFTAVSSGGGALGLILGGVLTDVLSWRWTLFINVPIGLIVLLLVRRFVNETDRRHGKFDIVGAITATGAAVALVYTLIKVPDWGWGSIDTILGLVVAGLLVAALVITERNHPHPLLRPALLRNHPRVAALGTMAAMYGAMMAMFFLMVQFLEEQLGYGPLEAGLAFLPMPLSVFTMSRITPKLVGRFGPTPFIVLGAAGMTLSFWHLTSIDAGSDYWWGAFPSLLLAGLSAGISFMPITATVLRGVEPEHAGSASGLLQTMQQLGGAVGFAIVTSVFAAHETGTFITGAHAGFTAADVLAGVALVSALTLLAARRRTARVAAALD
jgi:EmrB/QacA subfamily drug resistance transporter